MPPKGKQSVYDIYFKITQENLQQYGPKTILFYQVGAFFEIYGVQNKTTRVISKSQIEEFAQLAQLNIYDKGIDVPEGTILMAGFRDYSLDKYLKITTSNGFTAVVYIQNMSNPKDITREQYGVYSPGTFISFDTDSSQALSNNIVCIWLNKYTPLHSKTPQLICGISSAHIFTGETSIFEYEIPFIMNPTTFDELERYVSTFSPSEAIIISFLSDKETNHVIPYSGLRTQTIHVIHMGESTSNTINKTADNKRSQVENCQKQTYINHILSTFFGEEVYQVCQEFQTRHVATQAFCFLMNFIQEHSPDLVKKIAIPHFYNSKYRVVLANHTLKQLNIIDDGSIDGKQAGRFSSVSAFLNKCSTAMGRRAFQKQLTNPTTDIDWLNGEYTIIDTFMTTPEDQIAELRRLLRSIRDLEKICRQLICQKIYPNTVYQMVESIHVIKGLFDGFADNEFLLKYLSAVNIREPLQEFLEYIHTVIYADKFKGLETITNFQENIFKPGVFENLDRITAEYTESKTLFDKIRESLNRTMQQQSTDETEYIKVHETEKSGVSLQLTKKRAETLRNCLKDKPIHINPSFIIQPKDIRFTKASTSNEEIEFPQLTHLLKKMLTLKEQMAIEIARAFSTFLRTLEKEWYDKIDLFIKWVTRLDLLQCKTYVALKYKYCRPSIQTNHSRSFFDAKGVRHVLIEHIQQNEVYVTNDLDLSSAHSEYDGILLYGTNAVGKTSFIRAIGICIIMAQAGLYVPCSSFVYNPYTSVFSRILGNDNLFKGLSTFAVEMSELRIILKQSDEFSLILGDELCSGTEIESALSLFSAGLVELYKKNATFLFATHFHDITQYSEIKDLDRLGLKHMAVTYDAATGVLLYDRVLKSGQGSRMYGLEVCKSLYMDSGFLERAYAFRNKYFPENSGELSKTSSPYNKKKIKGKCEMCHKEIAGEVHHLAEQQMADSAGYIDGFHKNHPGNLLAVCEACHLSIHSKKTKLTKKKSTAGYILADL
jgi:DNA mismatch repair protein MutS